MAGLWDLLGWPGLTAAEQACAVTGAATPGCRPAGPGPVRRPEAPMTLLLWLAALPLRFLAALGLRRTIILVCLFTLAVTVYGVAEDLGLLEPPAQAAPAPRRPAAGQPRPSRAAG